MAASLTIEAKGLDQLQALAAKLKPNAPLMARVAEYLESSTRERFEGGYGPSGQAWKPSRRATLQGGKTLVDRGHLRDTFVGQSREGEAAVGSNDPRAAAHHFGVTIRPKSAKALAFRPAGGGDLVMVKSVTLPARPILGVNDDDRAVIGDIVRDYLAAA
jgi:phage virion morphogenesis protein